LFRLYKQILFYPNSFCNVPHFKCVLFLLLLKKILYTIIVLPDMKLSIVTLLIRSTRDKFITNFWSSCSLNQTDCRSFFRAHVDYLMRMTDKVALFFFVCLPVIMTIGIRSDFSFRNVISRVQRMFSYFVMLSRRLWHSGWLKLFFFLMKLGKSFFNETSQREKFPIFLHIVFKNCQFLKKFEYVSIWVRLGVAKWYL